MNMTTTQLGKSYLTTEQREENFLERMIKGLTRYPIVNKSLFASVAQLKPLQDATLDYGLHTINPMDGKPYVSIAPYIYGSRRAARFYLTQFEGILEPFFDLRLEESYLSGERAEERQLLLDILGLFPILNPSLLQVALNARSSRYFKKDIAFFVEKGIITLWHPDFLVTDNPLLVEQTKQRIQENIVTVGTPIHRGVRFLLTEHIGRLRLFLVK